MEIQLIRLLKHWAEIIGTFLNDRILLLVIYERGHAVWHIRMFANEATYISMLKENHHTVILYIMSMILCAQLTNTIQNNPEIWSANFLIIITSKLGQTRTGHFISCTINITYTKISHFTTQFYFGRTMLSKITSASPNFVLRLGCLLTVYTKSIQLNFSCLQFTEKKTG